MRVLPKLISSVILLCIFGFIVCLPHTVLADSADHVPKEVVIKLKPRTSPIQLQDHIQTLSAKIQERIDTLDVFVITVPAGTEERIATILSHHPLIEYAEPNFTATAFLTPNDPYFTSSQWGLENTRQPIIGTMGTLDADIDGPSAWDTTTGNSAVTVAILDTGIDQDHEDLSGKIISQVNFSDSSTVDDVFGHGTHVAGIVAANTNNNLGVAGGCPSCTLMNVKVLNDQGSGAYTWIAKGIVHAADSGAKVINLSLGGTSSSRTLEQAVNYAWNKGSVVVAAAGNSGRNSRTYPAYYKNVIAVAATDNRDRKASFSNYGSAWVDVAAPGVNILSTLPNHPHQLGSSSYGYLSGTSMATPMTAATVGLIWSTPYGTTSQAVRSRLESKADRISGTGIYWSFGRINQASAVQ